MTTLVEMYRHVGERFRVDVSKKDINATKCDHYSLYYYILYVTRRVLCVILQTVVEF